MIEIIALIGFLFAFAALLVGSETMRRTNQRYLDMQSAISKAAQRIAALESELGKLRLQHRRRHQTLIALERKGRLKGHLGEESQTGAGGGGNIFVREKDAPLATNRSQRCVPSQFLDTSLRKSG